MIKEIKYNGYSTTPSDYDSKDGELAAALNLINDDGGIKRLTQPKEVCQLPDGCNIVYIHKTSQYTHYIILDTGDNNSLKWIDESAATGDVTRSQMTLIFTFNQLLELEAENMTSYISAKTVSIWQVNSINNTLVVLASDGMHYILWHEGAYKHLGTHLPELPLTFGLQGTKVVDPQFQVNLYEPEHVGIRHRIGYDEGEVVLFPTDNPVAQIREKQEEMIERVTEEILAKVNSFITDHSTNAGKFLFPFLVRYAYRLYDGSLTIHSSPVLMVAHSGLTPQALITDFQYTTVSDINIIYATKVRIAGMVFDLDYCVGGDQQATSYKNALKDWSDVVKSVDIFVSAPLYTYDQSGKVKGFANLAATDKGYTIARIPNGANYVPSTTAYGKWWVSRLLRDATATSDYGLEYTLPTKTPQQIADQIKDCGNFYLLKSIELDKLAVVREKIEVPTDYLGALQTKEAMSDDYDSHDSLTPSLSYAYNHRMNIANIYKTVATPVDMASYIGLYTASYTKIGNRWDGPNTAQMTMYVYLKHDGREIVVQAALSATVGSDKPILYLYYPDPTAYKIVIKRVSNGETNYFGFPLKRHDFLNGAYYWGGWSPAQNELRDSDIPVPTDDLSVWLPNKIYTSEAENPYIFPVTNINTVGTGRILGMSAAVKAMSQGQYGQFPLYAFVTDGIWALETSESGGYVAKHPVSRDVCINPESITQLDNAVLFVTDRGIMLLSGSETRCLTDIYFAEQGFNASNLPGMETLLDGTNHQLPAFLRDCRMIYDYRNQRIVVFNPIKMADSGQIHDPSTSDERTYPFAYVYSLKSKTWGMMECDILSVLNSYPDALAMTDTGKMVTYDETGAVRQGVLVTRPLKLDGKDLLKSVHTVVQRGMFRRGHVKTALYGSRDLYNWHIISSSVSHELRHLRGTPYKYFRIAAITELSADESLSGASVDMEPRYTNTLR